MQKPDSGFVDLALRRKNGLQLLSCHPSFTDYRHGAAWRVECGLRVSSRGSAAPLLLVDEREQISAGQHTSTRLQSVSHRATPALVYLSFVLFFFCCSDSLVFTFSSETSQDLPVIPFVPLLPGDREWKQQSLFPTQPSPSCGTSASCCSFWESSEKLPLLLLASADFAILTLS